MKRDKTLRIARWEVTKSAGQVDRRTLALVGVALLLVAALTPMVASRGVTLADGIYRVGVAEDSAYYDPVVRDPTFVAVEPTVRDGSGELRPNDEDTDLIVCTDAIPSCPAGKVMWDTSPKGRAARSELRGTVERYNDERMLSEPDRAAAFPVNVTLRYVERDSPNLGGDGDGDGEPRPTARPAGDGEANLGGGGVADGSGSSGGPPGTGGGAVRPPSVGDGSSVFVDNERRGPPPTSRRRSRSSRWCWRSRSSSP